MGPPGVFRQDTSQKLIFLTFFYLDSEAAKNRFGHLMRTGTLKKENARLISDTHGIPLY